MSGLVISTVECAPPTATRDIGVDAVLTAIRTGGNTLRGQIEQIRNRFEAELAFTHGDKSAAKLAVAPLKKDLPAVMWCGQFSNREKPVPDKLQKHSGLIPADFDNLGDKLPEIRKKLEASSHLYALFLSPSGDGLKAIFRVPADASLHAGSFRAVEAHVKQLTGIEIDESGKDIGRLCFMSYDPDIYVKENAIELEPLPEPAKPKPVPRPAGCEVNLVGRQRIAYTILARYGCTVTWLSDDKGRIDHCPGQHLHTAGEAPRDCYVFLSEEKAPTVFCFHTSCAGFREGINYELRSLIGKAEFARAPKVKATSEPGEPQPVDSGPAPERPRIAQLERPEQAITFEEWRTVIRKNFPSLLRPAEACASVIAQLLLNDVSNPFALALVDVPSSGKTITLNFFDGTPELTYTTDNFTPASFVSHASNVQRKELGNVDLLPRIRFRTLIVRELGSIFGAKDDDLIKSLGLLTRVLDGEGLETDSGVHGRRGYKGDYLFMLLAGTPPIPPRVFKVMGNFGSRLFFLALHTPEESDDELVAQNRGEDRKSKENACKNETEKFLRTLWSENPSGIVWNKAEDPDICLRIIARCARLLAALRGAINVWHTDEGGERLSHTMPVIEKPNRINCLLYNLARGHAIICGRRQLTAEDLWPVLEVTFDSAPVTRAKLFRGLIEAGGLLTTTKVEKLLNCTSPTARKEMEALWVLGVADKTFEDPFDPEDPLDPGRPETQITLKSRFDWFISPDCKALMSGVTDPEGGNLFNIPPNPGIKKGSPLCICVDGGVDPETGQVLGPETAGQPPPATASLPVMITKRMEAELQAMGYSQAAVNKMTPGQAHRIISSSPGSKAVSGDLKL